MSCLYLIISKRKQRDSPRRHFLDRVIVIWGSTLQHWHSEWNWLETKNGGCLLCYIRFRIRSISYKQLFCGFWWSWRWLMFSFFETALTSTASLGICVTKKSKATSLNAINQFWSHFERSSFRILLNYRFNVPSCVSRIIQNMWLNCSRLFNYWLLNCLH